MTTSRPPGISVFITCYREGELLLKAVKSLEDQTDKDFELFIVNDHSPDPATNETCRYLENEKGVKVIWRTTNGGLAAARNTGFERMTGDVGVPLDADDILPVDAVSVIKQGLSLYPDADFLFGNYSINDVENNEQRDVTCKFLAGDNNILSLKKLFSHWRLLGTSPCSKKLWQQVGGYRLDYSNDLQDKDFWIRALQGGARGYFIDRIIYIWNRSAHGMNSSVSPEVQNKLTLEYLDFLQPHWSNTQTLNELARLGQYARLHAYARSCLKGGMVSPRLLFLALTPHRLLQAYYEAGVPSRLRSILSPSRRH